MRRVWGGVGVVAIGLLLSVYAWWPVLMAYPHPQGGDGPFYHQMIESVRVSVFRWHELPLWNPYQCNGNPLWDNPQGLSLAPLVWLFMPWGSTRSVELWYVSHLVLTFVSMWIFARRELRTSAPAALVAASVWAFCGYYDQHLSGGHFTWVMFGYLPLALFFWRRAEKDARFAVALGMLVAWEFYEGATYGLPHLAVLLAAETLTRVWPPRRALAVVKAAAIVGLVAFTLSACRLLPVMDQLRAHNRGLAPETDALQWSTLVDMFLARTHTRFVPGQQYVWPEFGAYVGPFILALAIFGVLASGLSNMWLVAIFAFSFALMMGHAGKYAPWSILKGHVYPFKQMRVPSRFNAAVSMFVAAFAALGIDRAGELAHRISRSVRVRDAARIGLLAVAFIGVGDIITVGIDWTSTCFTNAPQNEQIAVSPHLYIATGAQLAQFVDEPQQNLARTECWEEWAFYRDAPVWVGDVPQARALDPATATVSNVTRTQNTFRFDVDARAPARVLVNSGFERGWRTSVGETAIYQDGLLAVDVPAGQNHVLVSYWPHGLTLGLWLTALSAMGIVAFFILDARRRRR